MKPIPGFPGNFADRSGNVFSTKGPGCRKLKNSLCASGYRILSLSRCGKKYRRYVHRVVLEAYVGLRPVGHQARHLNGVRSDNRLENLAWGTRSENQMDRVRHGTDNRGERHPMSKYPIELVLKVREMCKTARQKDVAAALGIPRSSVSYLVTRGYKWLSA